MPLATLEDPRAGSSIPCTEFIFCGFLRFFWARADFLPTLTLRPNSARMAFQGNPNKMGCLRRRDRSVQVLPRQQIDDSPDGFGAPDQAPVTQAPVSVAKTPVSNPGRERTRSQPVGSAVALPAPVRTGPGSTSQDGRVRRVQATSSDSSATMTTGITASQPPTDALSSLATAARGRSVNQLAGRTLWGDHQ